MRAYIRTPMVFSGVTVPLRFGHWKGARIGVFCYGDLGHVDVDSVHYRYGDVGADEPPA